ncbi:MAG: hypothetical protein EBQ48_12375, partial [Betaproteobacteria bacterium]|nr:hypothetical protein [Betaproteobacteria bacterium]
KSPAAEAVKRRTWSDCPWVVAVMLGWFNGLSSFVHYRGSKYGLNSVADRCEGLMACIGLLPSKA